MTIQESIDHAKFVAKINRIRTEHEALHHNDKNEINACLQCAKEHEQLAEWLEELKQYHAIGTVEECREARERQSAKKPTPIDYEKYIGVVNNAECLRGANWCPNCKHVVRSGSYCKDCGQAIDWSE